MLLKFRIVCWQTVLPPGRDVGRLRRIRNRLPAEMGRIPSSLPEVSQILFRIGRPEIDLLPTKSGRSGRYSECYCYFCNDETGCHPASFRFRPDSSLLVRYAIPSIIAMTSSSLYNIVDSIFIGHGVGPIAISGVALFDASDEHRVGFRVVDRDRCCGAHLGSGWDRDAGEAAEGCWAMWCCSIFW